MGLLGAPTYPMLRDATMASLLEILDSNRIPYELNKADYVLTFQDTGSRVILRSMDAPERLRGTNLAWFGVDELSYSPEEAWLRLEGRLRDPKATRLCGFAVWTPKGFDWVYRKFIAKVIPGYETIRAKPMENRHLLQAVPDFYERLKASYDETFYRQEVLGEYINMHAGRVYPQFDRAVHCEEIGLDPMHPVLWALDFNVNPMCSVVAQIAGNQVRVIDEIVIDRAQTTDACEAFYHKYPRHTAGLRIYGDASGANQRTTGSSDYDLIRDYFRKTRYSNVIYRVPKRNPSVRDRISLLNSRLKNAVGDAYVRIHPRCKGLIRDLEEVCYKPDSNEIDKDRDPRLTHLSDALGYLVYQECSAGPNVGERPYRLL